jgi:hypothetical protein
MGVASVALFLVPVLLFTGLLAWYFSLVQTRRRRMLEVAGWLEAGLAGRGRVLGTRWVGPSDLFASLDLDGHRLYSASAHARLGGHGLSDRITLRCDLDCAPRFAAEILSERWSLLPTDAPPGIYDQAGTQNFRLGVYVMASGQHVVSNYRELARSLLNSQPLHVQQLTLSPESPHLELSLDLDFACPPPPIPVFCLLQRLAGSVPQHSR